MFDIDINEFAEGEQIFRFFPRGISSQQHLEVLKLKFKVPICLNENILLVLDMSSASMKKKKKLMIKTASKCDTLLKDLGFNVTYVMIDNTYIKTLDKIDDILIYNPKDNTNTMSSLLLDHASTNISNLYDKVIKDGKYEMVVFFSNEDQVISFTQNQINKCYRLLKEQNVAFFSFSSIRNICVATLMRSLPKLVDFFLVEYMDIDEAGKYLIHCLKNKKIQIMFDNEVIAYYNLFKLDDDITMKSLFVPPDRKVVIKIPPDVQDLGTLKIICGDFIHEQPLCSKRSLGIRSGFTSFETFGTWVEAVAMVVMANLCEEVPIEQLALYINTLVENDNSRFVLYEGREISLLEAIKIENEKNGKEI